MDQMVETLFLDNGTSRDLQQAVQWHLFGNGIKYWWNSTPTTTIISSEDPELVVMPAGIQIGNTYLLEPMTLHFDPRDENAEDDPFDFSACFVIRFHSIIMNGNEITSWDISSIDLYDDLHTAVISLKKEDPTCKDIPLPAAQ